MGEIQPYRYVNCHHSVLGLDKTIFISFPESVIVFMITNLVILHEA